MYESLLASLQTKQYQVAISTANTLLHQDPKDLIARYHLGIANFLANNRVLGLQEITQLFADHYQPIMASDDLELIQLLGFCGLQFAQLTDLELMQPDIKLTLNFNLGVRIATEAAKRSGNTQLAQLANTLQTRIHYLPDPNGHPQAAYIQPNSPRILQIEPTNQCNLKCLMCPRQEMSRKNGFLSQTLWKQILNTWSGRYRQITSPYIFQQNQHEFTVQTPGVIKLFFMGEPLLHKQLGEMIQQAHEHGCIVALQTNGLLLANPKIRQTLLHAQADQIFISIDGQDPNSYATIRQGSQWKPLVTGIRALHQERQAANLTDKITLCVTTIIPQQLPEYASRVQTFFQPLLPYIDHYFPIHLDCRNNTQFLDDHGQLKHYTKEFPSDQNATNRPNCSEPLYKMNILWDGRATPCCYDIDGQLTIGSSFTNGGIDALWQSQAMRTIQTHAIHRTPKHPLCQKCLSLTP